MRAPNNDIFIDPESPVPADDAMFMDIIEPLNDDDNICDNLSNDMNFLEDGLRPIGCRSNERFVVSLSTSISNSSSNDSHISIPSTSNNVNECAGAVPVAHPVSHWRKMDFSQNAKDCIMTDKITSTSKGKGKGKTSRIPLPTPTAATTTSTTTTTTSTSTSTTTTTTTTTTTCAAVAAAAATTSTSTLT